MTDTIRCQSTGGLFPHTHALNIPVDAINTPPKDGITLTTSEEYSLIFKHKHQVHITLDELIKVNRGEKVSVRDTDKGRHSFVIST